MPINFFMKPPAVGKLPRQAWFIDVIDTLRALRVYVGDGSGLKSDAGAGGQSVRVCEDVRFQIRTAVVVTQAAAATFAGGILTPMSGTMAMFAPDSIGDGTDPPTPVFRVEPRGDDGFAPPLTFWNEDPSGPSPDIDGIIKVHLTPFGWFLLTGQCPE